MGSAAVRLSANCCWLTPVLGHGGDRVELAGLGDDRLSGRQVEQGDGGPGRAVGGPEAGDAGDGELLWRLLGEDLDGVAHLEALAVGRGLVHDDFVGATRAIAGREHERVQLLDLGPAEAERGCALARIADGVAFGVDVLGEALDLAIGVGHAVGGQDVGQQALVDATPDVTPEPVVEGGLGPDDGVGALVDVGEQVVEDPGDGVGEDEGADDERHAEHHGDGRGQHASLAGQDPLQRDLEHAISPRGP